MTTLPACAGDSKPYDLLHDHTSGPIFDAAVAEARRICGTCPLQAACLSENRDTLWVQALLRGPSQRRRYGARKQAAAACGTDGGYYRHLRGTKTQPKSEPCEPCRAAHAAKQAGREAQATRTTCPECGCLLKPGEACPACEVAWMDRGAA